MILPRNILAFSLGLSRDNVFILPFLKLELYTNPFKSTREREHHFTPFQVVEDHGWHNGRPWGRMDYLAVAAERHGPQAHREKRCIQTCIRMTSSLQGHELQVPNLLPSAHYTLTSEDKRVTVTAAVVRDSSITAIISLREGRGQGTCPLEQHCHSQPPSVLA